MKSTASATAINGRWIYPDALRAAATIMVIILHVGGMAADMAESTWLVSANTLVRSAVPLFLMLNGIPHLRRFGRTTSEDLCIDP